MIYPQWNSNGYGLQDTAWQQGVATIKIQTGAQWIEIPVLFFSRPLTDSHRVGVTAHPQYKVLARGSESA